MKANIQVMLKKEVLDPQGKAVEKSLHDLGFKQVQSVRVGKVIEVDLNTTDPSQAEKMLEEMSQKLLVNPVIEDFDVRLV